MILTANDLGKIGQLGFQKWYERQLRHSSGWLVLAFACLIAFTIGFQRIQTPELVVTILLKTTMIPIAALVAWLAFRRYQEALALTDSLEDLVLCPSCHYPSFSVVKREVERGNLHLSRLAHDLNDEGLKVSCRRCHHKWRWGYQG
jgi:hypothetical protein